VVFRFHDQYTNEMQKLLHLNAVLSVFVALTITFALLTIGNWGAGHTSIVKAGGWVGLLTAALAWYASAAGVINDTHGKVVLPVGPLNK